MEDEIPPQKIISNDDGSKTVITYKINDDKKKVKITQKIKHTVITEKVHPLVAERKSWKKYGEEKDAKPGPDIRTTQLTEPVQLKLATSWEKMEQEEEKAQKEGAKKVVTSTVIKCRICEGEHFTAKCPHKDTLLATIDANKEAAEDKLSVREPGKSTYMAPGLRNRKEGDMGPRESRFERDDSTTVRITQLNEIVDENMLRGELLAGFHPLQRVTLVRNKETGKSKGLAYVAFSSIDAAQRAIDKLNGKGYHNLILHLEWSKPKPRT